MPPSSYEVLSHLKISSWHCAAQSECNFYVSPQSCTEEVYQHSSSKILLCISKYLISIFPYLLRMQRHRLLTTSGTLLRPQFLLTFNTDSDGSSLDIGQTKEARIFAL